MLPGIGSDIKDPSVREVAYDLVPVASLRELHSLLAVTRAFLPQFTTPLVILQSRDDHVVPPASAEYIYRHAGSGDKELVWLEDS
jgi:carboxylesterase